MTGEGAGPTPDKNGDMFQAPSRRDNVSPFEPDGQPRGGCPYKGKRMGNPECGDIVSPFRARWR